MVKFYKTFCTSKLEGYIFIGTIAMLLNTMFYVNKKLLLLLELWTQDI
jgi:hypothetical protein